MTHQIRSRYQPDLSDEFCRMIASLDQPKLHGRTEIVLQYEAVLGELFEADHVVTCNSGTTALELALRASCTADTTVVLPAMTTVMAYLPVDSLGLRSVVVDSAPGSLFPEVQQYANVTTQDAPAGSVLLTTSWWGYTPTWGPLRELCDNRGWVWIDDMAQAHGCKPDAPLNLPDIRCYSTHDRKLVTTGEGGFVCTDDSHAARRMASYASYGGLPPGVADLTLGREPGGSRRLSTLQAAYGLCSARALAHVVESRHAVLSALEELASGLVHFVAHELPASARLNGYGLILCSQSTDRSPHFEADYLARAGVQNDVMDYDLRPLQEYPLPKQRGLSGESPNASALSQRLLVLSPHQGLSRQHIEYISECLHSLDAVLGS